MKTFIFLLFPLFALSQSTYYPTDTLIDLYRVDTTIDTIPVIITYIDDDDVILNTVWYLFGYEVFSTIQDNHPTYSSLLVGSNYVSSGYSNIEFKTVCYLNMFKKPLPDSYKVNYTIELNLSNSSGEGTMIGFDNRGLRDPLAFWIKPNGTTAQTYAGGISNQGNWHFGNTDQYSMPASSIVTMESTTSGFLPPRMTKTQRDAISSPATGLVVYQTDNTPGLRCYNGTNWIKYSESTD